MQLWHSWERASQLREEWTNVTQLPLQNVNRRRKKKCSWVSHLENSELNYIHQDIHHDNGLRGQLFKKK